MTYSIGSKFQNSIDLTDKVLFHHMENIGNQATELEIGFDSELSGNSLNLSNKITNIFTTKIKKMMPKTKEIKKYFVKTITEMDDQIVNPICNDEIIYKDFVKLLKKENLNINPAMRAIFWNHNFFYNGNELDLSSLKKKDYVLLRSLLEELINKRGIHRETFLRVRSSRILDIIFFLYKQNFVTFRKLSI